MGEGSAKNVEGGRKRGEKWPDEVRLRCVCTLLVEGNLSAVAKVYGVPESTLRHWWKAFLAQGVQEQAEVMTEAQRQAVQGIAFEAAAGTKQILEMMRERVQLAKRNARRAEEIREALIAGMYGEKSEEELLREIKLRPLMEDSPMVSMARVLLSAQEKTFAGGVRCEEGVQAEALSEADRRLLEKVAALQRNQIEITIEQWLAAQTDPASSWAQALERWETYERLKARVIP